MKQKVKILEAESSEELESKINSFIENYEIRGIQLITTPLSEVPWEQIYYTALIKYQVAENDCGIDFSEVSHMFQNEVE